MSLWPGQVSFGPISWLIVGEIFPLTVRGPASALATVTNFGSNFLVRSPPVCAAWMHAHESALQRMWAKCACNPAQVSLVLPSVQDAFGPGATYLVFAVIAVVAVGTIYAIVPETKGKSLEEIERLFDAKSE
jgi:hypothetical protein